MYDKHDRQIRLLGKEVQNKITELRISLVDHSKTFISGEMIKNFTLLGSTIFKVNQAVLESYEELVLCKLDKNLKLEVVDTIDTSYDIKIAIDDVSKEFEDVIYVCSKCYSYTTGYIKEDCFEKKNSVEFDCLLGAFIVQELIKRTAGKDYKNEYTIDGL